jgi:transposase InsO family protein
MAESFVKSFKRDYVFLHARPDALSVLGQLAAWFEDYNEVRPHRGLRMCSPRQFIRTRLSTAACPV